LPSAGKPRNCFLWTCDWCKLDCHHVFTIQMLSLL